MKFETLILHRTTRPGEVAL